MINDRLWWITRDGDIDCIKLYEKHYSCRDYKDGRERKLFAGVGEKIVLRTLEGDALFVWRKSKFDIEDGINCAVFRNESKHKSSELIRQADAIADFIWPDSRHYTFINSERVKSTNPGFCFIKAGWRRTGYKTKGGLIVMERIDNGTFNSLQQRLR